MNKPNFSLFMRACALSALLWLPACGADLSSGDKAIGQRCFSDPDCVTGLVCRDRICIATGGGIVAPPDPDMSDAPPDQPLGACQLGERRCMGERAYQLCILNADGELELEGNMCLPFTRCSQGECINEDQCIDADDDGAFANCEPVDCDDTNPNSSPRAPELCNGLDDNCDGQIDEACIAQGCCDDGCPAGEACTQCACLPYDPGVCTFQDQPCEGPQASRANFICDDVFATGELRCQGICDLSRPNSCPSPGSVCAFDARNNNEGLCAQGCTQAQGCPPGQGCLLTDGWPSEGVCVSSGDSPLGAPCDERSAFSCASGGLCLEDQSASNQGAICHASCRPFLNAGDPARTDCPNGQRCSPLTPSVGGCVLDDGGQVGDPCDSASSTCGSDAVVCWPDVQGRLSCQQLCRLERDQADCAMGQFCIPFSPDEAALGVCMVLNSPG